MKPALPLAWMSRLSVLVLAAAIALAASGCGEKEVVVGPPPADTGGATTEPGPAQTEGEPAGPGPAQTPAGWRTHEGPAGLTIALPPGWRTRTDGAQLRIRSPRDLLVASLQADRSQDGRSGDPADYALTTLEALPGYRELEGQSADAPRSPYEVARAAGSGTLADGARRQRVSVTAFHVPGQGTYTAVAFSVGGARSQRRAFDRALTTLRVGQRSGRSG